MGRREILDYSCSVISSWRRSTAVLLATIVVALAAGSPAASAAPKEIAYRCGADICLLDPDNPSAVTNLTNNGNTILEETPVWSSDGTKLAYISRANGTRNLYVTLAEPTGNGIGVALQVTHYEDGGFLGEPTWSPDGSRIAFIRGTSEGNRTVLVAATDGTTGNPPTVAEHGEHPTWAPDGGKIAYSFGKQVFLKNADGSGSAAPLENGAGREPAWSPTGSLIAFAFPAHAAEFVDLHIVNAGGGGTPAIVTSNTQFAFPSWSPDGTRVAYRSTNENAGYVRVANADGGGDHPLASRSNVNVNSPASWSPNGARVVFYGNEFGITTSENIWIANSDGSGTMQPLTGGDAHEPVWKPVPRFLPVAPSGGSAKPIPKKITPKYFWIRTAIPWSPGQSTIIVGAVFCGDITCGANSVGKMKGVAPILPPRPFLAAASGKKKKPKPVVVAQGRTKVPAGKKRPLKLTLTKQGIAVLKQRGSLKISLTVTVTAPGRQKRVDHHTVKVVREAPKKHKRAGR